MAELSIGEKILKRKKDPKLQKQLAAEQLDFRGSAESEIEDALRGSRLQKRADEARKKIFRYGLIAFSIIPLSYCAYTLFVPYQAGLTFGVCRNFLELHVRYPQTLRLSTVDEIKDFVRIWYTHTDAFGQYRLENIQCTFEADETIGFRVKKISFNREDIEQERVDAFNKILPVIFANPPDLTYPTALPDSLRDLRIDTNRFRRPII